MFSSAAEPAFPTYHDDPNSATKSSTDGNALCIKCECGIVRFRAHCIRSLISAVRQSKENPNFDRFARDVWYCNACNNSKIWHTVSADSVQNHLSEEFTNGIRVYDCNDPCPCGCRAGGKEEIDELFVKPNYGEYSYWFIVAMKSLGHFANKCSDCGEILYEGRCIKEMRRMNHKLVCKNSETSGCSQCSGRKVITVVVPPRSDPRDSNDDVECTNVFCSCGCGSDYHSSGCSAAVCPNCIPCDPVIECTCDKDYSYDDSPRDYGGRW